MSKTDLVPTYYDGEPQHLPPSSPPLIRSECHAIKKQGRGWFGNNGRIFILFSPPPPPPPDSISTKFANVRDESVCVQETTMDNYVDRYNSAIAIINAYTPANLDQQPLNVSFY